MGTRIPVPPILFSLAFITTLATDVKDSPLVLRVYKVTHNGAAFDWYISPQEKQRMVNCEANYGPSSDLSQLEVLPNFLPEKTTFHISNLTYNVSYHFYMVCFDFSGKRFSSNRINFTTGMEVEETPLAPSGLSQSNWDLMDHLYPIYVTKSTRNRPSSSVILGAVCGIVGFLIINVTLIIAVRRCSQAQQRRRRFIELQQAQQQYEGILYIHDVEA